MIDDLPQPLWEANLWGKKRLCLVCAKSCATMMLRSTGNDEIVPLCKNCSLDWNIYGYTILKRIKPWNLIKKVIWFKLFKPFQQPTLSTIWKDINSLKQWSKRMKRWIK